jgi:hypothetical protein
VTRRKVSAGTRRDIGRDCRDAFLGLAKTCAKLEIAFWDYLGTPTLYTLMSLVGALGLMVQLVPDPDTQVQRRWKLRSAGQAHGRGRLSQLRRARADVLADLARKGGRSWWASMSPEQRQAHIAKLNAARAAKRQVGLNKAA